MIQSSSASGAKTYFAEALTKSDYYINDQELQGRFEGKLAERLNLSPVADKKTFFALCENVHPNTDKPLTPRTKENRTVGYDINFHAPKSVSVLHVLSQDDHLQKAFEASVTETMQDIEADSATRIRKGGKQEDRSTGEFVWAHFVHQTARPVDEKSPDPHLHSHCFVFNVTHDGQEQRYKAAKFKDIKRDMPYYQARFHKRLADRLTGLGYQVKVTPKSFEVEGVPKKVIDLFSKRTNEIGQVAKEKGITDAKELDSLGARTRSAKQKGRSMAELKADWKRQIKEVGVDEAESSKSIRYAPKLDKEKEKQNRTAKQCVDYALRHCFERASVMADRRLLERAYRYGMGNSSISVDDINRAFRNDTGLIHVKEGSRTMCTTRQVLAEEKRMVELARDGQGKFLPLYRTAPNLKLNEEQAEAVSYILTNANQVSIIRGAAGTGKTTLMKEAVAQINKAGKEVFVVAPTAEASRGVLKDEGFADAETVASLLANKQRHNDLKDQVLWVDEAGLLGTKDMTDLLELTSQQNARLILGGDTRQHASVARGDALRILNTVAGIKTAEVSRIYRQKNEQYRAAVEDLSKGNVLPAFEKLDGLGSIKTTDPLKPNEELVNDYVAAVKVGKSTLVISPTHKQGEETTEAIRIRLRQEKLLGKREIKVTRLVNTNLTEAEKSDWRSFQLGQVVQFSQNTKDFKRGSHWSVGAVKDNTVQLVNEKGRTTILPPEQAKAFDVFDKQQIALSKGDKIRITRNGFDELDKRLNNGQNLEVVSVTKYGNIKLHNKASKTSYELKQDFGHLAHAHCITSHASQGKTVDEVFIAQPAATFGATDAKQFYVSVSRGKEQARIYTDDKAGLLEQAAELSNRQSALELVTGKSGVSHTDHVHHMTRLEPIRTEKVNTAEKAKVSRTIYKERDYEPGF